jgi:hypothetical protein
MASLLKAILDSPGAVQVVSTLSGETVARPEELANGTS